MSKLFFLFLFLPSLCLAQSFPSTPILDTFSGSLSNFTGGITGTGACAISGGVLVGDSGTDECYYSASTFGANQEMYWTFPNAESHTNDANVRAFMCLQDSIGTSTVDGYGFRYRKVTGASNDQIQMFRMTNAGFTNIGTAHVEEFTNSDQVGMRIETGGTLTLYYRSGGTGLWTQIDQVTGETTHSCSGTNIGGIQLAQGSHQGDNLGGGNVTNPFMMILEAK